MGSLVPTSRLSDAAARDTPQTFTPRAHVVGDAGELAHVVGDAGELAHAMGDVGELIPPGQELLDEGQRMLLEAEEVLKLAAEDEGSAGQEHHAEQKERGGAEQEQHAEQKEQGGAEGRGEAEETGASLETHRAVWRYMELRRDT